MATRRLKITKNYSVQDLFEEQQRIIKSLILLLPHHKEELQRIKTPIVGYGKNGFKISSTEMSEELKADIKKKFPSYI